MSVTQSTLEATLETAHQYALSYLNGLSDREVSATKTVAQLRERLNKPLAKLGGPAEQVISELIRDVEGGLLGSAGGRFFACVIGGCLPSALAADWLTSTWDQNAVLHACGPAAAVVEEVAGRWLKEILGLPEAASFAFVNGCQMANVTCLAAARHALRRSLG